MPSASVPSKTRVAPATAEPEFFRSRFDGKYEVHRSLKSFKARVIVIVARGLDRSEEYCSSMHLKRQNLKTVVVEKFLQTVPHRHSDTWPIICTVINLLVGSLGSCILSGCSGYHKGYGEKLRCSQALPGQAITSAVSYFPSISCATSRPATQ